MKLVYGEVSGSGIWEALESRIELETDSIGVKYKRISKHGSLERVLSGVDSIVIHPAPPLYLPIPGLFSHVYIPISPNIYLAPKSKVALTVEVIPDIAVSPGSFEGKYIDVFPLSTPKMAVYGGPADGILARYFYTADESTPVKLRIPIEIENEDEESITISKVVAPIAYLDIYYEAGGGIAETNLLKVKIDAGVAEVSKDGYKGDLKAIPRESPESITERMGLDLATVKRFLIAEDVFLMDRGL